MFANFHSLGNCPSKNEILINLVNDSCKPIAHNLIIRFPIPSCPQALVVSTFLIHYIPQQH